MQKKIIVFYLSLLVGITLCTSIAMADTVNPISISATLNPGECVDELNTVTLTGSPANVDIMFSFDLTGSMGGVIDTAKAQAVDIMNQIQAELPDSSLRFGVVSYMDYPSYYSSCGYAAAYGSSYGDYAYSLDQALTPDINEVSVVINALTLGSGGDGPQDYSRIIYESVADGSNIGWGDSVKIWINFGDNVPHDCNINIGTPSCPDESSDTCQVWSTGADPGRDEILGTADDIVLLDALNQMKANNITLFEMDSGYGYYDYWKYWTGITGGDVFTTGSSGAELIDQITAAVESVTRNIDKLELTPPAEFVSWVTTNPLNYTELTVPEEGLSMDFDVSICVPEVAECGLYEFPINVNGDGSVFAQQAVSIDVPCNEPPECKAAYADPGCLWPPDNMMVPVNILGITDPDVDPVAITILSITSDEPTATAKGAGGSKAAPDASGVGTSQAMIRAERSGLADGRVYFINFTADDGNGGICNGSAVVNVPRDESDMSCPAVDSGQKYDATVKN